MEKSRRYELGGLVLDIPLRYDELSHMYIEEYPDFITNPAYTAEGCPVMFTGEDACAYAEADDGRSCADCGDCRFYRQFPDSLIGVCYHSKKRRGP